MIHKTLLQVNRNGAQFSGAQADLVKLRRHFERNHFVRLPGFLSAELLKDLRKKIPRARFSRRVHKDIAVELCMKDHDAFRLLWFLTNDFRLFQWIEAITGCEKIGCFTGRVYRMEGKGHHDDWHNDMTANRMVAMSVNVSEKVYKGGHLMLRKIGKPSTARIIRNTGFGDAILFHLSHELEHRIMNITGPEAKTAYAGWFRSKPNFFASIKRLRKRKVKSRAR